MARWGYLAELGVFWAAVMSARPVSPPFRVYLAIGVASRTWPVVMNGRYQHAVKHSGIVGGNPPVRAKPSGTKIGESDAQLMAVGDKV